MIEKKYTKDTTTYLCYLLGLRKKKLIGELFLISLWMGK